MLVALDPIAMPVALACVAHAWIIPELYASRGRERDAPQAGAARPRRPEERVAQGLLGDLLGHDERELQRRDRPGDGARRAGHLAGGEAGALLVTPGGKRVHCFCVTATDPELPPSDRIAHLLLALRTDETGFATVANHAFAGAPWRLRRRLRPRARRLAAAGALRAKPLRCPMAWNVVIAGGGFGGFYAARRLERVLPPHSARITLVTDVNFLLYTPLLPGARRRHARAAPRGGAAARGARLDRHPARPRDRRRPRPRTSCATRRSTAATRRSATTS